MNAQEQWLTHLFFPYKRISQVPLKDIQNQLISRFETWGKPLRIRVDNGQPLGDPDRRVVPVLSLWLIGYGIEVHWNQPRRPQQNAKVERCQGVLAAWVEPSQCKDKQHLQQQLIKQSTFYNYHFPIHRKDNKKRIELFPELMHTGRAWKAEQFSLQRVLDFLASTNWKRKASANGQFFMYGNRITVGAKYSHQYLSINLCPKNNQWLIFDQNAKLIHRKNTPFTKSAIMNLDLKKTRG